MEVYLYLWSTTAQLVSDAMIVAFLFALARSTGRPELRDHLRAWCANLLALGVAVGYWWLRPEGLWVRKCVGWLYLGAKLSFCILLIAGVLALCGRLVRQRQVRLAVLGALAYAAVGMALQESINELGLINAASVALLLWGGAAVIARERPPAWRWLMAGFGVRAALASIEAVAYLARVLESPWPPARLIDSYLAAHSSFDGAGEWMIALGATLTLYSLIAAELERSNVEIGQAKERMRLLAESDMLTGLGNRRSLLPVLHAARADGATILFFDLNDFKGINDRLGHQMGDACLKRFAGELRTCFRPSDALIRYAGDEFVVVAPAVRPDGMLARIEAARARLGLADGHTPPIHFSVGMVYLEQHGDVEAAMAAADQAMYRDKQRARQAVAG